MDLFVSDRTDDKFELLYKCLKDKNLNNFKYKDWLKDLLKKLLEYDSDGEQRPRELYEIVYNKFLDLFPYEGKAYHGILTMNKLEDILNFYNGLVSWSSDYSIAYTFAYNPNRDFNINTSVILVADVLGLNFSKILSVIYEHYKNDKDFKFINNYIEEKEVLAYIDNSNLEIININERR